MASLLGGASDVRRAADAEAGHEEALRARHVSVPQRRRAARRAPRGLHGDRHRLPGGPHAGQERDAPDGLRRLRPAGRGARDQNGRAPADSDREEHRDFRRQLKSLGFSYDWDRELATTDVEYFRWTQWIFLQIYDTWFDAGAAARPADQRVADSGRRERRKATMPFARIRTSIGWRIKAKRR